MVLNLSVVISRHFPKLYDDLSLLPDYRTRPQYQVRELIMSGLLMFLFRHRSRNNADNAAKNMDYQDNVMMALGIKVADMDTVNRYLKELPPSFLEEIKYDMVRALISSKVLQKYRFNGRYYQLAIDGSGMQSFDYEPYPNCPSKTYKSGKKIWTTYVLEAKIVTSNGMALSLLTEWIENPAGAGTGFNKQDSEQKAFKRLIAKLRKKFPRLPVIWLIDGLYPNITTFNMAKAYGYPFMITLKDKSLKTVQEQIADHRLFSNYQEWAHVEATSTHRITEHYKVFENIDYKGHSLCVFETIVKKVHKKDKKEEVTRFVHITGIDVHKDNVRSVSKTARLRWKIENEGFNVQKNNGYELTHKYSRKSFTATKNYYQLLQMAEMISQLTFKMKKLKDMIKYYGLTIISVLADMVSLFKFFDFNDEEIHEEFEKMKKMQLRY